MTGADVASKPADDAGILLTWRESPAAAKALLAGVFVNRLGSFIQIFLVLFLTFQGFSPLQAGWALGLYGAGTVVGVLIGGELTDRLGARRTILISMVGSAALVLAILYLHYYPALLVAVTVVGAVSQAYRPASAALLSELTPKHRQVMIFAMYRLAYNLGSTAAPLIGAGLLAASYDFLFWGEALAALGYAVVAMIALPRHRQATKSDESTASDASAAGYLAVMADRRYVLFLIALLVNAAVYMQYLSTLPIAMRAAGFDVVWFSAMVALNGFIVITFELLVTKVVQRLPMRMVVVVGFTLLGGGLACYALPIGVAAFIIGTLIWSLAEVVAGPTMFAYPAIASPENLRGRYMGAASAMFGLGSAIGPVAGLAAWNLVGTGVWWWYAAAAMAGLVAGWYGMQASAIKAAETKSAAKSDVEDSAVVEGATATE